jgi:hypothetical protein
MSSTRDCQLSLGKMASPDDTGVSRVVAVAEKGMKERNPQQMHGVTVPAGGAGQPILLHDRS